MARLPRYVLFAVLSLTFGSAAQAQWAVVDVRAIAQMTQQLSVLRQQLQTVQNQLTQAQREYQSITGSRGMDQLLRGTVRNYLSEAISKLGAANRVDAARIARQRGWL